MRANFEHPVQSTFATFVIAAAILSACSLGAGSTQKSTAHPLADGESLGVGTNTAGSAAADEQVRTLLSVTCEKSELIVRTSIERITATSDCTRAPLEAELDRALGLPAMISRAGDRLHITNPSGNTIDVQATDIMVSESRGTP